MAEVRAAAQLDQGQSLGHSICNSGTYARERMWTSDPATASLRLALIEAALRSSAWRLTHEGTTSGKVGGTYERTVDGVDLTTIAVLDEPTVLRVSIIEF